MSTTITVTLPVELAQVVSDKATASGKGLEEYLIYVLKKDAAVPSLRDLFTDVRADIEARGVTDEELAADIDAAVREVRERRRA